MTIRIHGPGVVGKTVHIQSPKCTIGSADGCTLRLRSAGVEAASCWILRGASGAIIRRLEGAALLNGRSFDEALLEPGDRLHIGAVELELVKLRSDALALPAVLSPPAVAASPSPPDSGEAAGRLAQAEKLAASRADELLAIHGELNALRQQLAQKHAADTALRTAADMARRELEAQSAAMLRREQELTEARTAASADRQAWTTERGALETQLSQLAAELRSAREAALESTMTVPLSRSSAAELELQSRCAALAEQLAQLQTQNQELQDQAQQRAELERRCQQLANELDSKCREFAELQVRESAAAARAQSQADIDERSAALARWHHELTERGERLTTAQQGLDEQRQAIESDRGELETERRRLAAEQNELTAERQQIAQQQAALAERARQLDEQTDRLQQSEQQLSSLRQQLEEERAALASQRQLAEERSNESPPEAAEMPAEQAAAPSSANLESPAEQDSNSVDNVLSRLVQAGLWRQDESNESRSGESRSHESPAAEPPADAPIHPDAAIPNSPDDLAADDAPRITMQFVGPPQTPAAAPASDEEESIESYMERLMQRVRGDSSPAPAKRWVPDGSPPPVSQPTKIAPPAAPAPPPQQPIEPGEYVPRSTAPELSSSLSAMRELANDAARTAIDHHIRRHTHRQATGKLFGTVFCLAAGGFLGYCNWQQPSLITASGAALSVLLAALWLTTGLRYFSKARQFDRPSDSEAPKA